ncbi:hypothetical protein OS493_031590 [Desmophyllum pertusum]|uniref:Uncharacterized protein n=1 Tax=Desmophyllum pertusum TaxID=174260 RepID=A0A9X0CJX4_9CNID|nr:hypothetical protein OS493_031590 [Desmophyllum pertusum]
MADGIEQVSSAAAGLLEAIGNLQRGDIRDLAVSTATNSSSVPSTSRSSEGNAIAAELGRRFPTFNARGGRGNTSSKKRSSSSSPMSREGSSKFGRPIKHIVHKDLVVIPNPNTNQVPSHTSKVKLEERGLIIHEFPFDRRWTPLDLKRNIESHLPRDDILFDYLKACYGTLVIPKLAKGVRMDGARIIKLSGQGGVYIRCLDPLDEEDKDEEDEQLLYPSYAQTAQPSDDSPNNTVGLISSPIQQPVNVSEPEPFDLGDSVPPTAEEVLSFPDMWNVQSTDDNEVLVNNEILSILTPSDHEVPLKIIRVHRSLIREDMIEIFSDPYILKCSLQAIIINQHGHDEAGRGSGVLREVFSLFWKECYESHMLGETERVPYIRHDFDRNKWEAVGRILVKGYIECQYFPLKISKAFLVACLFGEGSVTRKMLQDSFKHYVSNSEASLIEGCLSDSIQCDSAEMLEFLSAFDCKRKPTHENIIEIIREVSHKELIQKPQYVADCWGPIVSHLKIYFLMFAPWMICIPLYCQLMSK